MKDIVCFKGEKFDLGFDEVVDAERLKIEEVKNESQLGSAVRNKNVDMFLNVELIASKDALHFRKSGLDRATLQLAARNRIAVGFNFNLFLQCKNDSERAQLLGRMRQNVRLCRKARVTMVFASFARSKWEMRGAKDMVAFARVLGMTGAEAKGALNFTRKRKMIEEVRELRSE